MAEVYSGELSTEKEPINFGNFNIPVIKGDTGEGRNLEFVWQETNLGVRLEGEETYQFVDLKGEQGIQGEQGEQGIQGVAGSKGDVGPIGPTGLSAYELALQNGFEGTEQEWLLSLKGNEIISDGMAEGENITLNDSGNLPIESFVLKGNTEEELSVTGDVEIVFQNKNLFDYNVLFNQEKGTPDTDNLTYFNGYFSYHTLQLKPNTTYTISSNAPNITGVTTFIVVNSETTFGTQKGGLYEKITVTTCSDGILKVGIRTSISTTSVQVVNKSQFDNGTYYIQIEEGSNATDFVEHGKQTILLSLGNIKLNGVEDSRDSIYKRDDKWYVEKVYQLGTPEITEITDETLLSQLEVLTGARTYRYTTHIDSNTDNLKPYLKIGYGLAKGLMSDEDKEKINAIQVYEKSTSTSDGLMSAEDKTKLDEIDMSTKLNVSGGTLTGNLNSLNIYPKTNAAYELGSNSKRYSYGHFNQLCIYGGTGVASVLTNLYPDAPKTVLTTNANGLRLLLPGNTTYAPIDASAFNQQSSRRYKENIIDMTEEEANKIDSINVVKFDYKNKASGTGVAGVIAEDVYKFLPNIVTTTKIDEEEVPDSVDYSKFVPYLIKKVQMLEKRVYELENKEA